MKKFKKLLCILLSLTAVFTATLFSGCSYLGTTVKVENNYLTPSDEQWQDYLDKLDTEGGSAKKLQAAINRSLLCGISIFTQFDYNNVTGYIEQDGEAVEIKNKKFSYKGVYAGSGVVVEVDKAKGDAYVLTNAHVVYSSSSRQKICDNVNLFLYGKDVFGSDYVLYSEYVTETVKEGFSYKEEYVYYEADGEYYQMITSEFTGYEDSCILATVVGTSVSNDLALLKITNSDVIKNSDVRVAEFADSEEVYAGEQVFAIGNPEGGGMSATTGVISKESEYIAVDISDDGTGMYEYRVMRTDVAINGGNSGGGLFNSDGKLVGIVNAKNASEGIDNMGFALQGSVAKRLWLLMKENQSGFSKNNIGVPCAQFPADYSVTTFSHLDENMHAKIEDTLVVKTAGGGLEVGDVLKHIKITNGTTVVEDVEITRFFNPDDVMISARTGYTVTVTVQRGGVDLDVNIVFGTSRVA